MIYPYAVTLIIACVAAAQSVPALDVVKTALTRGDYRTAEAIARKALVLQPRSQDLLTDLGIALQMQGRSTAAMRAFGQALKLGYVPRTYALLAEEKCKSRDIDGARPMLAKILREDRREPLLLAAVAPCYLDSNEPVQAIQAYSSLLASPSFPHDLALIQLSRAYLLAGQFFYGRLKAAPESQVYLRAVQNAQDGSSPDARGAFDEAATRSPYFHPDDSFEDLVHRWEEHPNDAALVYLLSVLSSEASIHQVEVCSARFPDSPYLEQLRLEVLAEQGRDQEAEAGYRELLRTHPEIPDLQYSLGMLYRKQRLWAKAAPIFEALVTADPQNEQAAARLSEALEKLARWDDLRALLRSRVEGADPPLWASVDLAEAEERRGDANAAIRLLRAAEKIHPTDRTIHSRLRRLYRQTGDLAEAKAEARWLQASFSENP